MTIKWRFSKVSREMLNTHHARYPTLHQPMLCCHTIADGSGNSQDRKTHAEFESARCFVTKLVQPTDSAISPDFSLSRVAYTPESYIYKASWFQYELSNHTQYELCLAERHSRIVEFVSVMPSVGLSLLESYGSACSSM